MPKQLTPDLKVYDGSPAGILPDAAADSHSGLATATPAPRRQPAEKTADSYRAILRGGAEGTGCQSAALYVLEDSPSRLRLRASWGFDTASVNDSPRPLGECPADMEALSGHVVAVENTDASPPWHLPHPAPAALCLPIASPTTPLGTLWMFCDEPRRFDDRETNVAEIVAGRLASDLERDRLLEDSIFDDALRHQAAAAKRWWKSQLPTISPLIDGWDVAAWVQPTGSIGGDFYDWFLRPDHSLCLAVGDALARGIDAAMAAAALRASVRAHGQYAKNPHTLLERVNRTLWTSSAGDQYASLFFAALNTSTGDLRFAAAGDPTAIVAGPDVDETFSACHTPLGTQPDPLFQTHSVSLRPGHVLAVVTDGVRDALNRGGRLWGDAGLRTALVDHIDQPATEIATAVRASLAQHTADVETDDQTLLVVKRCG